MPIDILGSGKTLLGLSLAEGRVGGDCFRQVVEEPDLREPEFAFGRVLDLRRVGETPVLGEVLFALASLRLLALLEERAHDLEVKSHVLHALRVLVDRALRESLVLLYELPRTRRAIKCIVRKSINRVGSYPQQS